MPITSCAQFAPSRNDEGALQAADKEGGEPVPQTRPSLHVALFRPEIPQNTGNVARTCAATQTPLHLVEPLGFRLSDRYLKRAGLDYWPHVSLKVHASLSALRTHLFPSRLVYFSAHASHPYFRFRFQAGDCLVFGSETGGLPEEVLARESERILQIPIDRSRVRSLNLATSVGAALFEAIRQLAFCQDELVYPVGIGLKTDPRRRKGHDES